LFANIGRCTVNSTSNYTKLINFTSRFSTLFTLTYITDFIKKIAHVTGSKPIAVWSQSILDVSAVVNPLVAFYDIHGRKGEVLFFYSVPDTTRDIVFMILNKRSASRE
jgi:hypothetical protein